MKNLDVLIPMWVAAISSYLFGVLPDFLSSDGVGTETDLIRSTLFVFGSLIAITLAWDKIDVNDEKH